LSNNVTITGRVVEKNTQQPLEFATIILMNTNDNTIQDGSVTNSNGEFHIETEAGTYTMKIEFIGFSPMLYENILFNKDTAMPVVELEEGAESLSVVEITAEKSTLEYKLDKRVFNVGNDLISKGGSVNDLLNNVPSVAVDVFGAVSLRGNANVRILINGKPSVQTAEGGLAQIPSENIESIEVITNPSAKNDAEGTAGIINIVLKKNKISGFGSSLELTAGTPAYYGVNYNVNYKTNKFNIFSNFRYRNIEALGSRTSLRTNFEDNEILSTLDQRTELERNWSIFNVYLGGDYYINEKNTLTLSYDYRNNITKDFNTSLFNFFDSNRDLTESTASVENYKEPQKSHQLDLNYIKDFQKEGKKLNINFQYTLGNESENTDLTEEQLFQNSSTGINLSSRNIESFEDLLIQSDLKNPITNNSFFEVGIKGEMRKIFSDYKVFENSVVVDSLDNALNYKEKIYGAYAQYGNSEHKFQYLIGLRAEHANTESVARETEFNNSKKYTDLFLTLHLTYQFNETTNLQASYSRRIQRPNFPQINPFNGISDRRNVRIGNPDLDPMYTNSFELATLKTWSRFTLNPSIYYQHTTNFFEMLVFSDNEEFSISKPVNSGTEKRFGAELVSTYSPYKWWRLMAEINYYAFEQEGIFNVSNHAFTTRLNSTIKTGKWSFQKNIDYRGARQSGQTLTKSQSRVNLGISKDIWKDKATITLNVNNLFGALNFERFITG